MSRSSRALANPTFLLLVNGVLLGLTFPLGNIAGAAEVPAIAWAMLLSVGAVASTLPILARNHALALPRGPVLRYVVIVGLMSFVLPNLLIFSVIPKVGAGFTGLMFALSPVFTLTLSVLFGMRRPTRLGLAGIAVGFVGAALVAITRASAPEVPSALWVLAALVIPLNLAAGNVYRSLAWPQAGSPDSLAFWSQLVAVMTFGCLLVATEGGIPTDQLRTIPWAVGAQLIIAGLMFPVYFRLQKTGGPVLLSQTGYIAAAVGLGAATLFMGEAYHQATWVGAAIIAIGIAITLRAQMDRPSGCAARNDIARS